MFKIKFLPARFGDSIWIEYGDEQAPRRILIDGGTAGTRHNIKAELMALDKSQRRLDLLVVSHIDRDHIEGILGLLGEDIPGLQIDDFWFNGFRHLPDMFEGFSLGAVQGEKLTQRIKARNLTWNGAFDGNAVALPEDGSLPKVLLPDGMTLTLLSPTLRSLARLKPVWEEEIRKANLDFGFPMSANDQEDDDEESLGIRDLPDVEALADTEFEDDRSKANASSIAFLAEFDGRRLLLAADAHVGDLAAAIKQISPNSSLDVDLFKISHHGSKNTTSQDLIEMVDCPTYAISTNGSIFKHPHHEAVARVLMGRGDDAQLLFNYRSKRNEIWDAPKLKEKYGYRTVYPAAGKQGIEINVGE